MHTGRIGILPVTGNSMGQDVPWGSHVAVVPGGVIHNGNLVVARVGGYKNADDPTDAKPATVVKKFDGGRLVSTADATIYGIGEYELLGRVVAVLPVQRVCRWLDRGAATPKIVLTEDEKVEVEAKVEACAKAKADNLAARGLKCFAPPVLMSKGSVLRDGVWSDPGITPGASLEHTTFSFLEFRLDAKTYVESDISPVVPSSMTLDGQPVKIAGNVWLEPGKYRLEWEFAAGVSPDTPVARLLFYRRG
jgi:hypothetical protein